MIEFELTNKDVKEDLPDYGPVGSIVDIRTYRRWLPKHNRRETFLERNERVVDANLGLIKDIISDEEYNLERSIMLDHMNKLLALPSGRSMWIAGTEANKKHPASSFNCSALAINRVEAFTTVFELLMLGTGVGFRVFSSDINKLPNINKFNIEFEDYKAKDKKDRLEDTNVLYTYKGSSRDEDFTYIKRVEVGDSRQGWIDALKALLDHGFNSQLNNTIVFNFNSVRPLGERIKGFGGTASGHEALKNLLKDVYNIINECPTDKLRSIDCLDICCAIAKGVVAGNTRRSALLCLFEEGDDLMAKAKVNLFDDPNLKGKYYRIQSNNTEALGTKHLKELRAYLESNPDVTKEELWKFIDSYKPSVEWIKERFKVISNAGDPGFCNYLKMIGKKWLAVRKYRSDVAVKDIWDWFCDLCSNPCHRGDMKLLTTEGYKTFEELNGTEPYIINKDGNITKSKVWCSGTKEVFEIALSNKTSIFCTEDHVYLTNEGESKAIDLKGKHLVPFLKKPISHSLELVLLGFTLGDGSLTIPSKSRGEFLNIGTKDLDIFTLIKEAGYSYDKSFINSTCSYYVSELDKLIEEYKINRVVSAERELPNSYYDLNKLDKAAFLCGLYSANGSFTKGHGRVTFKTTSKVLAEQLVNTLKEDFGLSSVYITTNKSKPIEFNNGTYQCKESYDVNIARYKDKLEFFNNINFYHAYKTEMLFEHLTNQAPFVTSVKSVGHDKVYDFTEPETNWGVVEGFISHNCFEIVLSVGYKNGRGVSFCNLTTLPINKFVIKKCNNNDLCAVTGYKLDESALEQAIRLTVRMATRQTCVTMPRAELDDTQKAERLLGVSVTGWIQLFNKLDLSYTEQEELMEKINSWANDEATIYSSKLGIDRPLMVCCIKPEGTQAKVLGSSSGVHWDWAPYYINRIQMGANDALAKTLKEQGFSWIPTPYDLSNIYKDCDIWNAIERFRSASYDEKEKAFINSNAVLFEFPINSGMVESQGSVSASRQLQNVLRFTDKYVDHMVSSTITAKEDEWDNLAEELHAEKNWSRFFNAAFLSYYSGNHPLLPNEQITENQYNSMMASFKDSEWVKDNKFYVNEELLARLEQAAIAANVDIDDVDLGSACSTGGCPLR